MGKAFGGKGALRAVEQVNGEIAAEGPRRHRHDHQRCDARTSRAPIRASGVKEFHGQATETVAAPAEECFALFAAVDRYPLWYPDVVREVDVLGRDGDEHPTAVRAKFRAAYGPLVHDFDLVLAVTLEEPRKVTLGRVGGSQRFELTWLVHEDAGTHIGLDLYAKLRVPRFMPLDGIGYATAKPFVAAAKTALTPGP
jgi:Polyketide cyclase / dehydrase and lipid transport